MFRVYSPIWRASSLESSDGIIGFPYSMTTWHGRIFGKCASMISAVLFIATGMIGQLVFVASLKLPSWNGSISRQQSPLLLVPSGKMKMEIPFLIFSIPFRIVFNPSFKFSRSKNRQCRYIIQKFRRGAFFISFFATNPVRLGQREYVSKMSK